MNILVTKRAKQNYTTITQYITKEFGEIVAEALELKTIDFLDLLSAFPLMGSLEIADKNIRAFQLTKQTRVFYRVKNETIIILNFFDVRQSPVKKLK
jgi:plasmid stabilization system protein ParE